MYRHEAAPLVLEPELWVHYDKFAPILALCLQQHLSTEVSPYFFAEFAQYVCAVLRGPILLACLVYIVKASVPRIVVTHVVAYRRLERSCRDCVDVLVCSRSMVYQASPEAGSGDLRMLRAENQPPNAHHGQ
jgi:hypothetical protein